MLKVISVVWVFTITASAWAKPAPDFRGKTVDGKSVSLSEYLSGEKATFLSFWASWCVPCLEEMDVLTKAQAANSDLPFRVLTVNVDTAETKADVLPTIKLYKIGFPVVEDADHSIFSKYKKEKSLPFSVLIDGSGNILESFSGFDANVVSHIQKKLAKTEGAKSAKQN